MSNKQRLTKTSPSPQDKDHLLQQNIHCVIVTIEIIAFEGVH